MAFITGTPGPRVPTLTTISATVAVGATLIGITGVVLGVLALLSTCSIIGGALAIGMTASASLLGGSIVVLAVGMGAGFICIAIVLKNRRHTPPPTGSPVGSSDSDSDSVHNSEFTEGSSKKQSNDIYSTIISTIITCQEAFQGYKKKPSSEKEASLTTSLKALKDCISTTCPPSAKMTQEDAVVFNSILLLKMEIKQYFQSAPVKEKEEVKEASSALSRKYPKVVRTAHQKFINNVLKLKIRIKKARDPENEEVIQAAKKVQKVALQFFFSEELAVQKQEVNRLKEVWDSHRDKLWEVSRGSPKKSAREIQEASKFIETELKRCKHLNEKGKLFSLPKYYHCTDDEKVLNQILRSNIKVAKLGYYEGAFVSTQIEYTEYGPVVICLSDQIESQATKKKLPYFSRGRNKKQYVDFANSPNCLKNNEIDYDYWEGNKSVKCWIGFQQAIEVKHPKKAEDPLGYFSQRNVCYIGYTRKITNSERITKQRGRPSIPGYMTREQQESIQNQAKRQGVKATYTTNLLAMREFLLMKGPLTMPEKWKSL